MPTISDTKKLFIDLETGKSPDYELFKPDKLFNPEPFNKQSVRRLVKDTDATYAEKVLKAETEYNKDIQDKQTEWTNKCALSPLTGQVLMVGKENCDGLFCIKQDESLDEVSLLELVCVDLFQADLIIGHNIKDFDLPFIINRCRKHGIKPPSIGYNKGSKWYWNDNIIDTMELWGAGKWKEMISLNNLCKYFGIPVKDESIGKNFEQVFNDDIEKAIEYCKGDVERTKLIYEKLTH